MLNIGDLIIYPGHGICQVDEISDKTYANITKKYYVLHPLENKENLTINTPVNNPKKELMKLIDKKEAEKILDSFQENHIDWIEKPQTRTQTFTEIVNSGNRKEIARLTNTLMRKKLELEMDGRKFYEFERKLLKDIQDILFKELALALDTSTEDINEKISSMISKN